MNDPNVPPVPDDESAWSRSSTDIPTSLKKIGDAAMIQTGSKFHVKVHPELLASLMQISVANAVLDGMSLEDFMKICDETV